VCSCTTGKRRVVTKKPIGNLGGVESAGGDGTTRTWLEFVTGAADHAFLIDSQTLILPQMMDNPLTAYDLSNAIK